MKDYVFGNYLTKLRKTARLSQKELGARLGVSDKAVSRWENGNARPRADLLVKLAATLDTTVDALVTGGKQNVKSQKDVGVISLIDGSVADLSKLKIKDGSNMKINFIPKKAKANGNYLCSWSRQAEVARKFGITGKTCSNMRDAINEEYLFGDEALYHFYKREFREGLIFMLDDGWDVPYGSEHHGGEEFYGSLHPDAEKFKSLGDTPLERLCNMSKKIKELGYVGLGLWISPNYGKKDENGNIDYEDVRRYWEDRAELCHKADILYWKVDWGKFQRDGKYREIMTESCRKKAPGLLIEHAYPWGVFTNYNNPAFPMTKLLNEHFDYSDVFRTYDISEPFEYSETLKRVDILLSAEHKMRHGCKGLINVESLPFIATGLGLNIGIMDDRKEVEAALRWQRIAPPFSVVGSDYKKSEHELTDNYYFDCQPASWVNFCNKTYSVSVPAVMARNTKLPKVVAKGELEPFVLASKNPTTGALAVTILPRTVDPNIYVKAPADVTVYPERPDTKVGVFGTFNSLTLEYSENIPKNAVVWAQSLLSDVAEPITDKVEIKDNKITIGGNELRYFGRVTHDYTETYEPSLLVTVTLG